MKVTKDCEQSTGCWSTAPLLDVDGTKYDSSDNYYDDLKGNSVFLTIADGTALAIEELSGGIRIRVDIDGPNKGKTQIGSDIFDFTIDDGMIYRNGVENKNVLIPSAIPGSWSGNFSQQSHFAYSTAWVIKNDNLDYLKCFSDLDWETKTGCK